MKETEKEEERAAMRKRLEEEEKMSRARRLEVRQEREQAGRLKRENAREHRRKERELREQQSGETREADSRFGHFQRLKSDVLTATCRPDTSADSVQEERGFNLFPARQSKADATLNVAPMNGTGSGSRSPVENWELDCEVCGRKGINQVSLLLALEFIPDITSFTGRWCFPILLW